MASTVPSPEDRDPYADRRVYPRVPVALLAFLQANGERHAVQILDLSPGGAKLDCPATLPVGTAVMLDCRSLVADNSWNAGVVLGTFVEPPSVLDGVVGVVYQDGVEIGRGRGADALGHPFEPLAWLANHLAAQGEGVRKGDIVMTGSIVTTRFPEAAFSYRFDVSDLGTVEVSGA